MIRIAATTSPVELAWTAFDRAALRLNELYARADRTPDTPEFRAERRAALEETIRLHAEFSELLLAGDEPRPAA